MAESGTGGLMYASEGGRFGEGLGVNRKSLQSRIEGGVGRTERVCILVHLDRNQQGMHHKVSVVYVVEGIRVLITISFVLLLNRN